VLFKIAQHELYIIKNLKSGKIIYIGASEHVMFRIDTKRTAVVGKIY
jgi:hypothetical protein